MHTFNIVDNHLENPDDIVHVFSFSNKNINNNLNKCYMKDTIICLIHFRLFIIIIFKEVLYEIFNYFFI